MGGRRNGGASWRGLSPLRFACAGLAIAAQARGTRASFGRNGVAGAQQATTTELMAFIRHRPLPRPLEPSKSNAIKIVLIETTRPIHIYLPSRRRRSYVRQ